ncbi:MAG: hypothetical protein HAW61_05065 [Candidatus Portiera sp.]|nr:hypothetical protein [Portiera sp.]
MSSLTAISALLLSGSILGFLPDGTRSEGFSQGEIFLTPLAANYNNGFSISYLKNENDIIGNDNLISLDLAKNFSIRRWYFKGKNILEVGGGIGTKQYFSSTKSLSSIDAISSDDNELLSVGNDYIISNHIGYLAGSLIFRLSWNYESKQTSRDFDAYLADDINKEQRDAAEASDAYKNFRGGEKGRSPIINGDNFEFLIADIRQQLRYYIGSGVYSTINLNIDNKRFARVGFDYRGDRGALRLVFGGEVSTFGYNNWEPNYRATVGIEKSESPVDGWRLLAFWEEGPSAYGPYHDIKVNHLGIKATRFF